jgi:hypothetical protein
MLVAGGAGGGQICNWKLEPVEQEGQRDKTISQKKFDLINAVHQSLNWSTAVFFFCTK